MAINTNIELRHCEPDWYNWHVYTVQSNDSIQCRKNSDSSEIMFTGQTQPTVQLMVYDSG